MKCFPFCWWSSQGRDMRVCLWDLVEGRTEVVDSVWTGSVGFCQCSLLETSPGTFLLAFAGEKTEEVRCECITGSIDQVLVLTQ